MDHLWSKFTQFLRCPIFAEGITPSDFKEEKYFYELKKSIAVDVKENVTQEVVARLEESVELLRKKLEIDSATFKIQHLMNDGRWVEASKYSKKLLLLESNSSFYIHDAYILKRLNDLEGAMKSIEMAFSLDNFYHEKDRYVAYYNRACYRTLLNGERNKIFSDLIKAVELNPKYIETINYDEDLKGIATDFLDFIKAN